MEMTALRVLARVPGSIYTDLMRNNILKEDPYYGSNDFNYKWVSYDNWTFEKIFNADESVINKNGVYLVCHGLDTISKIYLNDVFIGSTDNMFIRYKFDIKPNLRLGQNLIRISFESAVTYAKKVHDQHIHTRYIVPPESSPFVQRGELHANYIRKMQSSFSWDWGPSFPTQGIWKNIEVEAIDSAIIRDISVKTIPLNNDKWVLNTTLYFESIYRSSFEALLQISIYNTLLYRSRVQLSPSSDGSATMNLQIPVNESIVIHKWYPNGMGSQMLYELRVALTTTEETFDKSIKIGFRTIELIQDPINPKGLTFYFRVNGLPLYAKGSNWIPGHIFQESLTTEYLRNLLQSTREANMNMLRVWGGGVYESDEFYEMADELGVLIWHDFMFACALYPVNDEFLISVNTEITQQVRRLQHHPSIALWAGRWNNENEAALAQMWWPEIFMNRQIYTRDYIKLYVEVIREIVLREDNSRPYLTSSPSNGLETIKNNWLSNDPQSNIYGDVHFYYYAPEAWVSPVLSIQSTMSSSYQSTLKSHNRSAAFNIIRPLLCGPVGNNENEAALAQMWWPEIFMNRQIYTRDYIKLYVEVIREIVLREDNSRPYLTSSPSNGLETIKNNWLSNDPQSNIYGDVHFYYYAPEAWTIKNNWLSNDPQSNIYGDVHFYYYAPEAWDWKQYPSTKFASEYGFQSYPSVKTLSKAVNSSDLRYPLTPEMSQRQHHGNGNYEITALIEKNMKLPVSGGIDRFNDFVYLSQIAQAMALK
ncbi:unnamed protein product, partial [Oppiella nova]